MASPTTRRSWRRTSWRWSRSRSARRQRAPRRDNDSGFAIRREGQMRRMIVLGALLAFGAAASLGARGYQPPAQQGPKVVEVEEIKDNLFMLKGGGGNTAVYVGASGVTVVDAKNPGWGQPILDKIKELTPKPVTLLINTHTHGDHVSGNVDFPASVEIVVQENTKANMEKMPIFKENGGKGLPKKTFKDKTTL